MDTKIKLAQFVVVLMLVLGATGISTSVALAAQPVKYDFSFTASDTFTDYCSFPVTVEATFTGTGSEYYDKDGALTMVIYQIVQQDTFTANGKALSGMPYRYMLPITFDSAGNITGFYNNGVVEKIRLPDGSLFFSAGRTDTTDNPYTFFLIPDKGRIGDQIAFCAALAP